MNPRRRAAGIWTNSGDGKATGANLTLPGATEVGDLVVIGIGARDDAVVFSWPSYVTAIGEPSQQGPAVAIGWFKVTQDILDAGVVPVAFSSSTYFMARTVPYDGTTVDFSSPVSMRTNYNGYTDTSIVLNPVIFDGWTDHEPTGRIDVAGGAMHFQRANVAIFSGNGATWSTDISTGSDGPSTADGMRARVGFTHASGDNGTNLPGGGSLSLSNLTSTVSNVCSTVGWAVQGITSPTDPATGDAFTATQTSGTLDVDFTSLIENDPRDFEWDFGDGATSTAKDPTHTFAAPGDYTVVVTAGNAANPIDQNSDYSASIVVTVSPLPPTPDFVWGGVGGSFKVNLRDRSLLAASLLWEVYDNAAGTGTPTTYTTPEVTHEFAALGDYLVRLTATNPTGSVSKDVVVRVALGDAPPVRQDGISVQVAIEMEGKWEPITCEVMDMDWVWGTEDDLGVMSVPGSARLILRINDPDRTFDPENTASEFYGRWNIGSLLRIRLGDGSDLTTYWHGFIADLSHDLSIATLQGDDGIARVANYEADINGPLSLVQDTASARLDTLLDVARWPGSWKDIEAGGQVLVTTTVTENSVWQAMTDVQKNDLGRLMTTQDGIFQYQSRGTAWSSTEPVMLFGCTPPDGSIPDKGVDEIVLAGATRSLYNLIRAGRKDGEAQTYRRQASIDKYQRFTAVVTDLLLSSQQAVEDWADHILDRMAEPSYQGRRVSFYVTPDIVAQGRQPEDGRPHPPLRRPPRCAHRPRRQAAGHPLRRHAVDRQGDHHHHAGLPADLRGQRVRHRHRHRLRRGRQQRQHQGGRHWRTCRPLHRQGERLMPTRSFGWRKSISLIRFSNGTEAGSGPEKHASIGTNNGGDRFRFLVRFQQDFSGVEVLTKATLKLRGTGSANHIGNRSGTIRVARLNKSFADNGGSEGYWVTNAGTVFSDPTWGNAHTFSISPANDKDHELDITNIVRDWLDGSSNYGLMIDDNGSSLQAEFGTGRSGNAPTLVIEYENATKPTVEFVYPGDENFVPVLENGKVGLDWKYTLGVTDTALTTHTSEVVRVSDDTVVESMDWLQFHQPVLPKWQLDLDPGEVYDLKVTVAGNGGAGSKTVTRRFVVPIADALYAVPLGVEPEAVGVNIVQAEGSQDDLTVAYAKSTSADESGIEGWWSSSPPTVFTDATFYYLLVRLRLVRRDATYFPVQPDGVDRIRVSWRSKA